MVNKIFLKFSIFYGHVWKSLYKNDDYSAYARHEWRVALERFDEKVIDEAVEECLKRQDMPPSLPLFLDFCRQLSHKHSAFYRPEPVEKAHPSVAAMNLGKIRAMLNMRNH